MLVILPILLIVLVVAVFLHLRSKRDNSSAPAPTASQQFNTSTTTTHITDTLSTETCGAAAIIIFFIFFSFCRDYPTLDSASSAPSVTSAPSDDVPLAYTQGRADIARHNKKVALQPVYGTTPRAGAGAAPPDGYVALPANASGRAHQQYTELAPEAPRKPTKSAKPAKRAAASGVAPSFLILAVLLGTVLSAVAAGYMDVELRVQGAAFDSFDATAFVAALSDALQLSIDDLRVVNVAEA